MNGSFESFTNSVNPGIPSQLGNSGTSGYTRLTDWDVGPGNTGHYGFLFAPGQADTTGALSPRFSNTFRLWGPGTGSANGLTASSPVGGNYLALDGDSNLRGTGVSQTISGLTAGQTYGLSFYWAAAQQHRFDGDTTEQVQVMLGAQTYLTSIFNLPNHGFSGWMQQTFNYTATSGTAALNFLAIGTPNGLPPFVLLDGVSLDVAVPEPSSVALAGLGIIGFGVQILRRRMKRMAV